MSNGGERTLWQAVRVRVVGHYLGQLACVLGLTTLVPMAGAAVFGELRLMAPYAAVAVALLALGLATRRLPAPRDLQHNEALVVIAAAFLLSPLIMSGPMALHGMPYLDALFEAISGVTTTGLSTLPSVEGRPRTFLLARAWLQWVGGLGFVVLSVALILGPGLAARRLASMGIETADVAASMRVHARRVLGVYLALTALGLAILAALGAGAFGAVVHTFAAVSTGGFAPNDASLAALGRGLQCGVLALSLLGAISLPLYVELRRGRWRRLRDDPEVWALGAGIVLLTLALIAASRLGADTAHTAPADLALLAVSAHTTSGFSTFAPSALPPAGQVLVILAMLTGGALGSTAGGVKLLRLLVMLRLLQWLVAQTRLPSRAVSAPTLRGERLTDEELLRAAAVIMLYLAVVLVSWLPFLAYGYPPLDALFEVVSATGTVGLSIGITRPELEPLLKGVLCMDMYLGRLEVFALLVMLSPRTWIGRRTS